ncbi:cytochrome c [Candidatus Sumerlaeota bacterium]|nr:cytochrome c [Candidatus Sumerlaeota bacterium]
MSLNRSFVKSAFGLALIAILFFGSANAYLWAEAGASFTPTYAADVAPIILAKCADCHRPGQIGPMALLNYDDTRPWAKSIKKSVVSREMPPWHADPACGKWANDMSLSPEQIETISRWVDAGAPPGDLSKAPAPPHYTDDWQLGKPDVEIELPETRVPSSGPDILIDRVVQVDIPEGRWLAGVEFLPGDRRVVHHITGYVGNASMHGPGGEAAAFSPAVKVFVIWGGRSGPAGVSGGSRPQAQPPPDVYVQRSLPPR